MVIKEYAVEGEGKASESLITMRVLELAFPYRDAVPTHLCQSLLLLFVALFIPAYLLPPKFSVGLWQLKIFTTIVTVPKATVDKDACTVFPKHQIGMPGEPRVVETIAEATRP